MAEADSELVRRWFVDGKRLAFCPPKTAIESWPQFLVNRLRELESFKATTNKVAKLCLKHGVECRSLLKVASAASIDLGTGAFYGAGYFELDDWYAALDECHAVVKELQLTLELGSPTTGPTAQAPPAAAQAKGVFVPTDFQQKILDALDGRSLKKVALAAEICDGEWSRLYRSGRRRKGDLNELKDLGLVDNKDDLGYYRPDRPPWAK